MSKIWLTSDTHFNHTNIAGSKVSRWKSGYRDFDSVEEMNKTIIQTFNKYVAPEDTLFHLGDFCLGGHKNTPAFRHALQVQNLHLIRGNHDEHIGQYESLFTSVHDDLVLNKYKIVLHHYKKFVWYGAGKGYYHAYGHSHSNAEWFVNGKSMDVGIDNIYKLFGEYRPIELEEFYNLMDKRDIIDHDHHTPNTNLK